MTEGTLRSVDPFVYFVNNISDFDSEIAGAFINNNTEAKTRLLNGSAKLDFDVFICVNKAFHAFVLCSSIQTLEQKALNIGPDMSSDPFDIPGMLLVWTFELCFENEANRTYKIRKQYEAFKEIKARVYRSYYIGRYRDVAVKALQFAALSASPKRYRVMLDDCVEFAKSFCVELLSHCSNWRRLERHVESQIQKATASGLSAEQLSRRIRSSAAMVNTFLGGSDATAWFSAQASSSPVFVVFLILYPIVVSVVVVTLTVLFIK